MYHECHLVHADLSEYNILYHQHVCYIIDVSQAVEHEHPNAHTFLKTDCVNITRFFRQYGVVTMAVQDLFHFVIQSSSDLCNINILEDKEDEPNFAFKSEYIPRTLNEVVDIERDVALVQQGLQSMLIYHDLLAPLDAPIETMADNTLPSTKLDPMNIKLNEDNLNSSFTESSVLNDSTSTELESDSEEDSCSSDDSEDLSEDYLPSPPKTGMRYLDKDVRRQLQKEFKEKKRESRKTKVPKMVKKRREKLAKKGQAKK
ncbi:protein kinase rio1 [Coelomomyces lativittatus]|nr:protein kinase rio1 [Coelomomyces lativittatus]KAJ1516762.1 protein kinase rio1 [Coelomomyces lativittatus]